LKTYDEMIEDLKNNCIDVYKVLLDRMQELKLSAGARYRKWKIVRQRENFSGTGTICRCEFKIEGAEGRLLTGSAARFISEDLDLPSPRPETGKTQSSNSITEKDHAIAIVVTLEVGNSRIQLPNRFFRGMRIAHDGVFIEPLAVLAAAGERSCG
jgi:hypothetical protein